MRIKTFYAKSMADALQDIKSSLGPDALLLSTREVRGRSGARGASSRFEVVAATDRGDEVKLASAGEENPEPASNAAGGSSDESHSLPEAAGSMTPTYSPGTLSKRQSRPAVKRVTGRKTLVKKQALAKQHEVELQCTSAVSMTLYQELLESGVHEWLAARLVNDAVVNLNSRQRRSRPAIVRSMANAVRSLISASRIEDGMPGKKIVAFVGPTGVGKTTSIAKLAAHLALRKRKKVVLMTLDGYRIGAVEQLKSYAGLMGIPFRFVGQVSELSRAIREQGQRDYILIDTAGRGPKDIDVMGDLAAFLQTSGDIERHLVLSATTKSSDLKEIVDRFEICKPDHLLFTKLDETTTLGPILNELVRTQKPLSYCTDGQRVPEDLHAINRDRIIEMVLHKN